MKALRLSNLAFGFALLAGLLIFGFPLYWMIRGALIPQALWIKEPIVWIPALRDLTLDAFRQLFGGETHITRVISNSALLAFCCMTFNVVFDCMAGFALAKMKTPGRKLILGALLFTMMIPFESMMVTLYLVVAKLSLANTMAGVVLPMMANAFGIILMHRFFEKVPDDLIEAALIDGADWGTILWRVAVPLAAPAIATIAVFNFLAGWEAFIWPMLITDPNSQFDVLQKVIANATYATASGSSEGKWSLLMATALVSTLPVLLLFLFGQRFFVKGLSAGAIKG